jgi:hypothetical protein
VRRVQLFPLGYAKIWRRFARAPSDKLSEADFRQFRAMRDFAHQIGDILALFADTLKPRGFDEFLTYGFAGPTGRSPA